MSDDKKNYTTDELEWIDKAMVQIGSTIAAECIRRGPVGVAAVTREIVEAMVKERREMRAHAIAVPTIYDAIGSELRAHGLELRDGGGPLEAQPTTEPSEFDGDMTERLAALSWDAQNEALTPIGASLPDWKAARSDAKNVHRAGIHAIIAELASTPVELPTWSDLGMAADDGSLAPSRMHRIANMLQTRLGPILAAKNIEREQLNKMCIDAVSTNASVEHRLDLAKEQIAKLEVSLASEVLERQLLQGKIRAMEQEAVAKDTRIAELTKQRDEEHGLSNLRSFEIDTWKKELADARAKVAELERELASNGRAYEMCNRERADLETRLGEKTAELAEVVPYAQRRGEALKRLFAALEHTLGDYDREECVKEAEAEIRRIWEGYRVSLGRIETLERHLADEARMVKEWHEAVDALHDLWPQDVDYRKPNPTHAEWIRDLVAALGEKAKERLVDVLEQIKHEADTHDTSVGQEHRAIMMPVLNQIIDEELAKLKGKSS